MNCPKCNNDNMQAMLGPGLIGRVMVCMNCDWNSETLEALVLASPSYRLAQLQAKGAAPGWYGPDGERTESKVDPKWGVCVRFDYVWVTEKSARLCGFVEVKA